MSGFIEWLERLNETDTRVRAVLRRSLAFEPAAFPAAYPLVEPFLKDEETPWRREMFYLVAGLWAAHWREDRGGERLSIGSASALHQSQSPGTERRFVVLLDADADQLPHRLRQMGSLLKDYALDFGAILDGLLYWNDPSKRTQKHWARDFYRNLRHDVDPDTTAAKDAKP
ncbi:MAG: type I-E CRISPR-associated protein Cse2/CasB [Patescibacteria group bacterium]|nr:type I-E CRISPR-associated protein Cse2/CasB [Patescibacteria group bacterium]